ncbi:energy transducer TonB [Kordiimonas lipolytica]|uniref:Energy transducer TonB n=1 Tax=Kordiimonas lipolytica TaxID=1662421 RepID=A0ABV8UBF2_9PROT|nr:energy transducer TonB [Kordiimonas lipolytica]
MVFGVLVGGVEKHVKMILALLCAGAFMAMATPAYADELQDWQREIVKKIVKSHIYPRSAIAREIEGRAKVSVTIDRSGKITGFEVLEPTGESQLDNVIPKMMEKMDPLPAPPDSLPDGNLTFTIPIAWRLQ